MKPLIWIIDEEWPDYEVEKKILKANFPDCCIKFSGNDYETDLNDFGLYADAILCQVYVHIPKAAIDKLQNCRIISLFGGGFDRIDTVAARAKGIDVTFVPGYCTEDLSDYVMAGIYYFNKRIDYYGEAIKKGLWGAPAVEKPLHRIRGSVLLIIGLGRIGRAVAKKGLALNMIVIAYDPYVDEGTMKSLGVVKVGWDYGITNADFISLNPRYYDETDSLVSLDDFKKMKRTACLINTSRGRVVVQKDLIQAVNEKMIAGAVLDVVADEPPAINDEIFRTKNIIVTPHISYISQESFLELKTRATNNVVKVLTGQPVLDMAN